MRNVIAKICRHLPLRYFEDVALSALVLTAAQKKQIYTFTKMETFLTLEETTSRLWRLQVRAVIDTDSS